MKNNLLIIPFILLVNWIEGQEAYEKIADNCCSDVLQCLLNLEKNITEDQLSMCVGIAHEGVSSVIRNDTNYQQVFLKVCQEPIRLVIGSKKKDTTGLENQINHRCTPVVRWWPAVMNVLYEEIENPLTVLVAHADRDTIQIEVSQGTIIHSGGESYRIKDLKKGDIELCFKDLKGKRLLCSNGRVKSLPEPNWYLTNLHNKSLTKKEMVAVHELKGHLVGLDFYVVPTVSELTLQVMRCGTIVYSETNKSSSFSEKFELWKGQLQIGDIVFFLDIKYDYIWQPNTTRERYIKSGIEKEVVYVIR